MEPYADRPRTGKAELGLFLDELGGRLARAVLAWDIGGGPMVLRDLKAGTKDIDLVVRTEADRNALRDTLVNDFHYAERWLEPEYAGLEGLLLAREGSLGVDVFLPRIMEKLYLSDGMKARASGPFVHGRLTVSHCSNEDIFLLKSVTNRPDDEDDILILIGTGLDSDVLNEELTAQAVRTRVDWAGQIRRRLAGIEERRGIPIPLKDEIGS